MPLTQQLLLRFPSFVLGLVIVGGAVLFSIIGVLVVRSFVPKARLKDHHDVAGPILGALSVVYAVLLAFVAVNVWQNFEESNTNVELEANYLTDLYTDSEAFSGDFHQKLGGLLREYKQVVVNDEWKTMARGEMSPKAQELIKQIWSLYTVYAPKTPTEQSFFDESVRKLNQFRELRSLRIMESRVGMQPLLWFVLIIGGLSVISFTFLFGMENLPAQLTMAILLAVVIALVIFVIMAFDYPFTGEVSISSEPFKRMLMD